MALLINTDSDKFLFIHIPKTGGTSFEKAIKDRYSDTSNILGHINLKDSLNIFDDLLLKLKILALVRNPWDWYVSWYHYLLNTMHVIDTDLITEKTYLSGGFNKFIELIHKNKEFLYFDNGGYNTLKFNTFGNWLNCKNEEIQTKLDIRTVKLEEYANAPEIFGLEFNTNYRLNTTNRKDYRFYYDNIAKQTVYRMHKEDIEKYDYKF